MFDNQDNSNNSNQDINNNFNNQNTFTNSLEQNNELHPDNQVQNIDLNTFAPIQQENMSNTINTYNNINLNNEPQLNPNPFNDINNVEQNTQPAQQEDFSYLNELSSINSIRQPEINPYQNLPETPSIVTQTNLPDIDKIKLPKKNNLFQVMSITLVALVLSIFMICCLVFNVRLLRISGTSMSPTMTDKDWVISTSKETYTYGDVVAFYHNDVIMIKRIIGLPGDVIMIDEEGNVYVNDKLVDEPYIPNKDLGKPEIDFPHTVHPDTYFVLGDNRGDSIDSRTIAIRDIKSTDVVGKVEYSIIPLHKIK